MKRGELSEADDTERNFAMEGLEIRSGIYELVVDKYNEMYQNDPAWQITGFSMQIDEKSRLRITDVQTFGDDPKANAQAESVMNSWLSGIVRKTGDAEADALAEKFKEIKESAETLGAAILDAHDDEHGDVKEFKHEVVFGSGLESGGYKILSPDGDKAALQEMKDLTQDIGNALGNFFGATMGIESPFDVIFGSDGLLTFEGDTLSPEELEALKQVLEDINRYLAAEEAGEDTEGMLSAELTGIGEKLAALKEVRGKIHDKSLISKEGSRFSFRQTS